MPILPTAADMNAATAIDSLAPRDPRAGAHNLLLACAGARAGDSLLLIVEPPHSTHYDPAVAAIVAGVARDSGLHVEVLEAAPGSGPHAVPEEVLRGIERAAHTIFLNRIGDQLRFVPLPGTGSKTMCYALDPDFLGSAFAVTPYALWSDIHDGLSRRLDAARSYSIRCPLGTQLQSAATGHSLGQRRRGGFTVKNFPIMIGPPIPSSGMSGRLVLSQTLTSTYVNHYADSVLPLRSHLTAYIDNGRITRLVGSPADVERAEAQFARVGALFGGNTWAVNSWHAGINPFTFFPRPALTDIDRWSSVSFGSPRYAHFHMCGSNPGDICGQIFDPTIAFDDTVLWDAGRPAFLDAQARDELAASLQVRPESLDQPRELGIA